jgi:hypothetical protein
MGISSLYPTGVDLHETHLQILCTLKSLLFSFAYKCMILALYLALDFSIIDSN